MGYKRFVISHYRLFSAAKLQIFFLISQKMRIFAAE
jgi:hypothetical protein